MLVNVLSEGRPVLEFAQQLYQFGIDPVNSYVETGLLTSFNDGFLHFLSDFFDYFLDSGGVNSAVVDEPFKGYSGYFTPDGVVTRKDDRFWSVVNYEVYARSSFYGSNITAFSTDDSPFHLLAGQVHD